MKTKTWQAKAGYCWFWISKPNPCLCFGFESWVPCQNYGLCLVERQPSSQPGHASKTHIDHSWRSIRSLDSIVFLMRPRRNTGWHSSDWSKAIAWWLYNWKICKLYMGLSRHNSWCSHRWFRFSSHTPFVCQRREWGGTKWRKKED